MSRRRRRRGRSSGRDFEQRLAELQGLALRRLDLPPPTATTAKHLTDAAVYRNDWKAYVRDLVRLPHIKRAMRRHGLVCPITDANRRVVEGTRIGQLQPDGTPVGYAIGWLKSRRVHATSVSLGFQHWASAVCGEPAVTLVHVARGKVMRENSQQFQCIHEHARAQRPDVVSKIRKARRGQSGAWEEWEFANGGTFLIMTGGKTLGAADDAGRSTNAQSVHVTEAGQMRYPGEMYSAIKGSSDLDSMWMIWEGTSPRMREHWFYQNWSESLDGRGIFNETWFVPWHWDPLKRLRRGSPQYEQVMSPEFEQAVRLSRPEILDEEIALELDEGLDDLQVAWRRAQYCRGSDWKAEMQARREYPEHPDSAYRFAGGWLSEPIRRRVRASARDPLRETSFSRISARLYSAPLAANQHAIVSVDSQEGGQDDLAAVGLDWTSGDVLFVADGQGLHEDLASAVAWCLRQLIGEQRPHGVVDIPRWRYTLTVERNRGRGVAPCLELEGLKLWNDPHTAGKWGHTTDRHSRQVLFDRIHASIGDPDRTARVYDRTLVKQLCLVDWSDEDRRLDVTEGKDDVLLAYGGAMYCRSNTTPNIGGGSIGSLSVLDDVSPSIGLDGWSRG